MRNMEHEYVTGQDRDHFPALLARFREEGEAAAARSDAIIDRRYGDHPRQLLDFLPATGTDAHGVVVYFHAGYWQSRDKSHFRFLATSLNRAGLHVAFVNYPLCPDVTVPDLIELVQPSIPVVQMLAANLPITLMGHSAGGHIAVETTLRWPKHRPTLRAVISLSGVFDLRPLVQTSLNTRLQLDLETARSASPLLRLRSGLPAALFCVGGAETEAFIQQNEEMADAWIAAGNDADPIVVPRADHFTILSRLTDSADYLHQAVIALTQG